MLTVSPIISLEYEIPRHTFSEKSKIGECGDQESLKLHPAPKDQVESYGNTVLGSMEESMVMSVEARGLPS